MKGMIVLANGQIDIHRRANTCNKSRNRWLEGNKWMELRTKSSQNQPQRTKKAEKC